MIQADEKRVPEFVSAEENARVSLGETVYSDERKHAVKCMSKEASSSEVQVV